MLYNKHILVASIAFKSNLKVYIKNNEIFCKKISFIFEVSITVTDR